MECKCVEQWLIENDGKPLTEEVARHLETCACCREWKSILDALAEPAAEAVLPPTLDANVKMMASRELGWRRRMKWLRRGLATAAACVVAALAVFGVISRQAATGVKSSGELAMGTQTSMGGKTVVRTDMEAAWDSLVLDCVTADDTLFELEGNLGGIGHLQARATETSGRKASYGVVFEDAVDLENSMSDLELVVYGL